jgi:hypothetical protein
MSAIVISKGCDCDSRNEVAGGELGAPNGILFSARCALCGGSGEIIVRLIHRVGWS